MLKFGCMWCGAYVPQNREHFVRAKIDTMTRDLTDENQALLRQVNSLEEAARISKVCTSKRFIWIRLRQLHSFSSCGAELSTGGS